MKQIENNLQSNPLLQDYVTLLLAWQKSVNLISPSTIETVWTRHVLDSAQLFPFIPKTARCLVDMGSGAGFPGVVLACLMKQEQRKTHVVLIESDLKKSLFLKEVIRRLNLNAEVLTQRLETVSMPQVDVVTARALSPLKQLFYLGKGFIQPDTLCLFLKGEHVDREIEEMPSLNCIKKEKSITNSKGCILIIKGGEHV